MDIGRSSHAAPNHIVASITERSMLHGSDIGKIEIYDDYSVVAVPADTLDEVLDSMYGAKVCGRPVKARAFTEKPSFSRERSGHGYASRQTSSRPSASHKSYPKRTDSHSRSSKPMTRRKG